MLKEKFNTTIELLGKQNEANDRLEYVTKLKNSLDEMRNKTIMFIQKLDAFEKMHQLMGLSMIEIDKTKIRDSIKICLSKDAYSLTEVDFNRLSDAIVEYGTVIDKKWCAYTNNIFSKNISSMRTYLPFCPNPEEMKKIISLLEKYLNTTPENARIVESIHREAQKGEKIINDLSLTEDRRRFLNKIANGNATLDDLSPDILLWIKSLNFTNRIKLRINS